MSRDFRIWVTVTVATRAEAERVIDAIEDQWPWSPGSARLICLGVERWEVHGVGDGTLGGGYTDEQFARDLRRKVWTALQGYAEVSVRTVCTDPTDFFVGDELEFAAARDGGLLLHECEECRDPLPFGRLDPMCPRCRAEDDAYRAEVAAEAAAQKE